MLAAFDLNLLVAILQCAVVIVWLALIWLLRRKTGELQEVGRELEARLLTSIAPLMVNGPHVVGPEPEPYKRGPDAPERVELLEVKDIRPTLVTPPPKLLN